MPPVTKLLAKNTVFFLCDVQTKFRGAIHEYDHVIATAGKMFKIAKVLNIPVLATEQSPTKLGPTVPELDLPSLGELHIGSFPKTLFSMLIPEVRAAAFQNQSQIDSVVLFGIESHVCVLQTALDLLRDGIAVHVLADGVSSCNPQEVPIALNRIRDAGGCVSTSESVAFQLMGDANSPSFRAFSALIKEEKEPTQKALAALLPSTASRL